MDDNTISDFAEIPMDVLLRANQRCEEFEAAWNNEPQPRIEDFLGELPVHDHPVLLWDFIRVDWECRCRFGEKPNLAEYAGRFDGVDREWLEQAALENPPATVVGKAPSNACQEAPTKEIGDYVLLEKIGVGGMGTVWKAQHRHMNRIVALKMLSADLAKDDKRLQRFRREIKAAAQLTHDHIVTAYDAGEEAGLPYLVMEFVEGTDLSQHVRVNGPCSLVDTLDYISQAARGLEYAHHQGIIHRDVKPSNLLLDAQGLVKVLDLGLARLRWTLTPAPGAHETTVTTSKEIIGTPSFMAPEQANDAHAADHRADIYSLGCTLFFLATGKCVYEGQSHIEALHAHQHEPVVSLRGVLPIVPKELDRVFQRMVAKNPYERYQSMREVLGVLERLTGKRKPRPGQRRLLLAGAAALSTVMLLMAGVLLVQGLFPVPPPPPIALPRKAPAIFSTNQAGKLQQAWAKYLKTKVKERNSLGMEVVLIPPGEFLMGTSDKDLTVYKQLHEKHPTIFEHKHLPSESPQHRVHITQPFRISATEVTYAQFQEFAATGYVTCGEKNGWGWGKNVSGWLRRKDAKYTWRNRGNFENQDDSAVGNMAWDDAVAFCTWLSARENKTYRLPTEAEWEYACRAGNAGQWCFGNKLEDLTDYAWYVMNAKSDPHPVARKKPNAFGLYDMHGNLTEWCHDWYDADYYKTSVMTDPKGRRTAHSHRVVRSATFFSVWEQTRSAARTRAAPDMPGGGFRVVMELE